MYFFKFPSQILGTDQTNRVYSNDDQGTVHYKCNFMTPGAGVLVIGRGHIGLIKKMHYFSPLSGIDL